MTRVAVLASHPTQYFAPFFRGLAALPGIDLTVLYCSRMGTGANVSPMENFGRKVIWDVDLLTGYEHRFLRNAAAADPQRRWSMLGLQLHRELRPDAYDVVVNFGWAYPADWLSFAVCHRRGIPFLLYGDTSIRDDGEILGGRTRHAVLSALCRRAAGALYTGTFNRDFYIRHGMDPIHLWFSPYAVDNEKFATGARDVARAELGLDDSAVYLLFVGTLIERKRPLDLLDAVLRLQAEGARVGAIFAGSGELEDVLRRRVVETRARDVHLLGFVNQSRLPRVYAAADVLVLPSDKDPRATVVNEAMAAGLPVVISSGTGVWGPSDLVRHGSEGLVYRSRDGDELARSCRFLLDRSARLRMGRAAVARVQIWSYDVAARGWRDATTAVAGRPPAPDALPGGIAPPRGPADFSAAPQTAASACRR